MKRDQIIDAMNLDVGSRTVQTVPVPGGQRGIARTTEEYAAVRAVRAYARECGLDVHINRLYGDALHVRFADKPVPVVFDTIEFVLSHGKEPRGYGSWAFGIGMRRPDVMGDDIVWCHGSYTEAKQQARATLAAKPYANEVRATGATVILYVLP